jgi:glyoxylase-like metal-dependent hydrolase (beta-lactamase superfamily II)/ketosteroid isomerase-like protein
MSWTAQLARRYFDALNDRDLDRAVSYWRPGAVLRVVGQTELGAPGEIKDHFAELFAAFPDWQFELVDLTQAANRCAVRWKVRATFAGPGQFRGFAPSGSTIELEGCDVLSFDAGMIIHNDAFTDSASFARQIGMLPPRESTVGQALTQAKNLRTSAAKPFLGSGAEQIADGVWVVRGGVPRTMNVFLIAEPGGGVTVFDAGVSDMSGAVATAAAHLGGVRRVVLGHADCDHRGAAAGLKAPVYCHPLEVEAAQSPAHRRDYWDTAKLALWARPVYPQLFKLWDGDPVQIAGTVADGDEIADFRVVELPGHAPGLIGLYRRSDGLALVSDTIYTLNVETGIPGPARVPHPAFNQDTEQARASIRKLRALRPTTVWAGHAKPVTDDVAGSLDRAAAA